MAIGVREINDPADLAALRPDWERLLAQTPDATYFHTLDWLEVYWRHFAAGQRLRVLVVEEDGAPSAIVPLVVRGHRSRLGTLRYLTYPLAYWGSFYGPIGPRPEAALAEALGHVRRTRRDWQVLELRWLGQEWIEGDAAQAAARTAGLPARATLMGETSFIDLDGTWEEYLAARGSKFRNNLQRWRRRLEARGPLRFVRHRPAGAAAGDADPRWDLYDDCERIAQQSWQADSQGTTLSTPAVRGAFRDWHAAAARRGDVDLNLLYVGERPMAFIYNYCHGADLYSLRVGYNPEISKDGAGNVLYLQVIEDSFRRGDRRYDLGSGSLEAKRHIKTRSASIWRLSHFPLLEPRAQLVRWRRWRQARDPRPDEAAPAEIS